MVNNEVRWRPVHPGSTEFRELLVRIADGEPERERQRILPYQQVGWLREAGLGRLRIPVADGGAGLSIPDLFEVIIDLSEADTNVAHVFRAHFGFVEQQLHHPEPAARRRWIALINDGNIVGNATTEQGTLAAGRQADRQNLTTTLVADGAGFTLNGVKFYSTGTLYSDWISVEAHDPDRGLVAAIIPTGREGVVREDDWDGFGQRLTGTGTTRFHDVRVRPDEVLLYAHRGGDFRPSYFESFYELYLQAVVAGALSAAQSEAIALTRRRTRNFSHASHPEPTRDPQVLQAIGEIAADAQAARAIVRDAANVLQSASDRVVDGELDPAIAYDAQIVVSKAKVAIDRFACAAATRLLDAGGASATRSGYALDRFWRNLRTLASHNPTFLKATAVGDFHVNGTPPPQNGYF